MTFIHNEARYKAAIERNIRMNAQKTAQKVWNSIEDHDDLEKFMNDNLWNDFVAKMWDSYLTWGKLTPKQVDALRNVKIKIETNRVKKEEELAAKKAEDAKGEFVEGDVKDRKVFELKIEKVLSFESQFGYVYIHLCKDQANTVVYKGSKRIGNDGDEVKVKATIKGFEVRDGVKQTIIARPAMV